MKTVVVVRPDLPAWQAQPTRWNPTADAFKACFTARGWNVIETDKPIKPEPDLVAGYGWREVMRGAYERWPAKVLHCDLGFWSRDLYMKLAWGGRWSPVAERDYDGSRLGLHGVRVLPGKPPGKRVLLCGMSEKAANTWGYKAEEWERQAAADLTAAGATVIYRPKPTWSGAKQIRGTEFDYHVRPIEVALAQVDAVATHHSNVSIDALADGLPVYCVTGLAKVLSVPVLADIVGARAPSLDERIRLLNQVAWHQWTFKEIAAGAWLDPPAPLSGIELLR